jgi:PLP dependent protein
MKIVPEIFGKIESTGAQVVVVTKYFDAEQTKEVLKQLKKQSSFLALGENRIGDIGAKNIPRKYVHFIGNIQSRNVSSIMKHCCVVHSLCNEKHAKKLNKIGKVDVFIQVNISRELQKSGIFPEDLPAFLEAMKAYEKITILGISAMGAGGFSEESKRAEFIGLKRLRDKHLPEGKISAGTSRDFEIALEEGIDIVRVGQAIFDL